MPCRAGSTVRQTAYSRAMSTPVVPFPNLEERPDTQNIRLSDISCIVIGCGHNAQKLVEQRRAAGGRVCWLYTNEAPSSGPLIDQDADAEILAACHEGDGLEATSPRPSRGREAHDTPSWACPRNGGQDLSWDLSTFVWRPCGLIRHQGRPIDTAVARLRHSMGSTMVAWRTSGPHVVSLQDDQKYRVADCSEFCAPGVQVVNCGPSGEDISWAISGIVIFADAHDGLAVDATTPNIDLSVLCEEAKPFITVKMAHVVAWSSLLFVQHLVTFILMNTYEPGLRAGDFAWWRASLDVFCCVPFGYSAIPCAFGPALTGRSSAGNVAVSALMGFDFLVAQFAACLLTFGRHASQLRTCSSWAALWLMSVFYLVTMMPVEIRYSASESETRPIRLWNIVWFVWILTGTLGAWLVFYGVALVFIKMSEWNQLAASLYLPAMTSAVEMGVMSISVWLYDILVHQPRMRCTKDGTSLLHMAGDQKKTLILPVSMSHTFAEATRLVSLLVSTIKQPGWEFVPQLLVCFAVNVTLRSNLWTEAMCRLVPQRWWWLVAPDSGTFLLNEVKLCFGYPRFVAMAALAVSNVVTKGISVPPFFNMQAALLLVSAFFLEVLEDVVVTRGWLTAESWSRTMIPYYRRLGVLSPWQVRGFDRDGVQPSGPAIGFSGMRFLEFRAVIVIVLPALEWS
mmetsp:Transcript_150862/g.482977  ORF Transcript_150862/g.482977 Transcript_150862/m.482977 type:complete len:681 (-) Transcript_150862:543-2585(-)